MYIILVYDIGEKRVQKVLKYLRQHLNWVQRSVFEGEVTESQLEKIKLRLKKVVKEKDSIYIYKSNFKYEFNKEVIGSEIGYTDNVL